MDARWLLALSGLLQILAVSESSAQIVFNSRAASPVATTFPRNRTLEKRLQTAREAAGKKEIGEAVRLLQVVIEGADRDADAFIEVGPGANVQPQLLSDDQYRRLRIAGDANGDGHFTVTELTRVFIESGTRVPRQTGSLLEDIRRECARVVSVIDTDMDGRMSMTEIDRHMATPRPTEPPVNVSLKSEAVRLLQSLGDAGLEAYEIQFGTDAAAILREAITKQDFAAIESLSRRVYFTRAGQTATQLIATWNLDNGDPLTAALQFSRLLDSARLPPASAASVAFKASVAWVRAGLPDEARRLLALLKEAAENDSVVIGGKTISLFDDQTDPVDWLEGVLRSEQLAFAANREQWPMFGGDANRNAAGGAVTPVWEPKWRVSTVDLSIVGGPEQAQLSRVEESLRRIETGYARGGLLRLPGVHPLIVGDRIIIRSLGNLKAISLEGQTLWETVMVDPAFNHALRHRNALTDAQSIRSSDHLQAFLTQRVWDDLNAGTLSSDGESIFAVEELGLLNVRSSTATDPLAPTDWNVLRAYSTRSGKLLWEIGGPRRNATQFSGHYFLGPPLPLGSRLYALSENGGQIMLLALQPFHDPNTATWNVRLEWSLALANARVTIGRDPNRRVSGLSPTYSNGKLICATSAGVVAAVNLAERQLEWGYRYPVDAPPLQVVNRLRVRPLSQSRENRWIDAGGLAANGRVMLTPRDSQDLHCLDLETGKLAWKQPRSEQLYIAAVHEDKVIAVGRSQVHAWSLANGSPAWRQPTNIDTPVGRGVRHGDVIHVPMNTGEVASIDLRTGRRLTRTRAADPLVLGNLVTVGDRIVSQTATDIVAFESADEVLQRFDLDPADSETQRRQTRIQADALLQLGDVDQALDLLRTAALKDPEDRHSRELLEVTLIEGLRTDFAENQRTADELQRSLERIDLRARVASTMLLDLCRLSPASAANVEALASAAAESPLLDEFARIRAEGLIAIGNWNSAFDALSGIGERASEGDVTRFGQNSVSTEIWAADQLRKLAETADSDSLTELNDRAASAIRNSIEHANALTLEQQFDAFSTFELDPQLRRKVVRALATDADFVTRERALRVIRDSGDSLSAAVATHELLKLYLTHNVFALAKPLADDLRERFADVAVEEGKTGSEIARIVSQNFSEQFNSLHREWDNRKLLSRTIMSTRRTTAAARSAFLAVIGNDHAFKDWGLYLDPGRLELIAVDAGGVERWKTRLRNILRSNSAPRVYAQGHVLVFATGLNILVFDASDSDASPKLLWRKDAISSNENRGRNLFAFQNRPNLSNPSAVAANPVNGVMPLAIRVVTNRAIFTQSGRSLASLDLLTGRQRWVREDVDARTVLLGDDQHLLLAQTSTGTALVLDSNVGRRKHTADIPVTRYRANSRGVPVQGPMILTPLGSRLATVERVDDEMRLSLLEPVSGVNLWTRSFGESVAFSPVADDHVAVADPKGRLAIVSLHDGSTVAENDVAPFETCTRMMLIASQRRFVVLATLQRPGGRRFASSGYFSGDIWCVDRLTGELAWTVPVDQKMPVPYLNSVAPELQQPLGLPVLLLMRRLQQFSRNGTPIVNRASAEILDLRNGSSIHTENDVGPLGNLKVAAGADPGTVNVHFMTRTVILGPTGERPGEDVPEVAP